MATTVGTCGGCPASWTGLNTCHCASCHRTFSGPRLFDDHRSHHGEHGDCRNPATLVVGGKRIAFRGADGIWHGPEMSAEVRARRGWQRE